MIGCAVVILCDVYVPAKSVAGVMNVFAVDGAVVGVVAGTVVAVLVDLVL